MADYLIQLAPDEYIVKEVRRHMFVFYARLTDIFILFLIPLILLAPLVDFLNNFAGSRGGTLFALGYILWIFVLFMLFFLRWTDYYLDVWVITNRHMFDVEQKGMFHRDVSLFRIEHIQDVTLETKGLLATFLRFGTLHIHTAGEKTDITITHAAHPLAIKKIIMEQHTKALQEIQNQSTQKVNT